MTAPVVKTSEVTSFLKYFVELVNIGPHESTKSLRVDEQGFIEQPTTTAGREWVRKTIGDPARPVVLYQETIPDAQALVLNPLAEGAASNPVTEWFYSLVGIGFHSRLAAVLDYLIDTAIVQKASKTSGKTVLPAVVLDALVTPYDDKSTLVDKIDEKTKEELATIRQQMKWNEFFGVYFDRRRLVYVVQSAPLSNPDALLKLKVRKTTVTVLAGLIRAVLGLKRDEPVSVLETKAEEGEPVRLGAFLRLLYKLFQRLNELAGYPEVGQAAIDLATYANHLDRLPGYYNNAKYFGQAMATPPKPAAAAHSVPSPASTMPSPGGAVPTAGGTTRRIPGPAYEGPQVPGSGYQPLVGMPGPTPGVPGYQPLPQPGYAPAGGGYVPMNAALTPQPMGYAATGAPSPMLGGMFPGQPRV